MALVLKRIYGGYFLLENEIADSRASDYILMKSPIPTMIILFLWFKFVTKWGPDYMKNREPHDLKTIMIFYNIAQVIINAYFIYYAIISRHLINWRCTEMDYSNSYWGRKFLSLTHLYFLLKIFDLIDTIFFVFRKKQSHITFLHTYHHFGMVALAWLGAKFLGGGHSYFLGFANGLVHVILYCYYLLTAYDSKYGKLLWLKKFITQAQLIQFLFLFCSFGQILFRSNCSYPKLAAFFLSTQNLFMIVLFGDFYVRTYIWGPPRKKLMAQQTETAEIDS